MEKPYPSQEFVYRPMNAFFCMLVKNCANDDEHGSVVIVGLSFVTPL